MRRPVRKLLWQSMRNMGVAWWTNKRCSKSKVIFQLNLNICQILCSPGKLANIDISLI